MIKSKKLSLTLINSLLLIIFLVVIIVGISTSVYFSTQKVIEYNVHEYFKQTNSITDIILKSEQKSLNDTSFEISQLIKNKPDILEDEIASISAVDQIDLLFQKKDLKIINYSNSLFDTESLINKILKLKISLDNFILPIRIDNEELIVLLSNKKIVDDKTGRVVSQIFVGKILNDNFSIMNSIKEEAFLEDVYVYFNNDLIATTSNDKIIDMEIFKDGYVVNKNDFIYFDRSIEIYDKKRLDIIFVTKNATFGLLKEDFKKISYLLLTFVLISFLILYFSSNKYIITPFSKLINYAKKAKDNKTVEYEITNVVEFDNFALDLKDVIDELREMKEQYSRAIDGVQDGLWDLDLKSKTLFCSNRYYEMIGFDLNDNINSLEVWKNSIHKDDYISTLRKIVNHKNGKSDLYEDDYRFLCKDGSYKWIKIRGKIFYDEDNCPIKMTGFHTDIDGIVKLQNDNLQKEQMLYQQSKLASMGEMIGNIAHQWRQPLNVISTIASSQIMQIELGITKKEETKKNLEKLMDTVHYLSTIIDKFRYFFNPNKELEFFYLDNLVNDNLEIFESSYKSSDINLVINLEHIELSGYKFELMQVIINIINNSKDALLEKYNIDESKYIFMRSFIEDNHAVLCIYDNAGGIKESLKEKIYEPYFTTKHQSQGTGLGLYMSSEIIKKHYNGKLQNKTITFTYNGKEFKGEEFMIKLPL